MKNRAETVEMSDKNQKKPNLPPTIDCITVDYVIYGTGCV